MSHHPPLLSIPPELQVNVFCFLNHLRDVTAFASACHALNSLLESNAGTILRAVGRKSVLAFDDALRAARASTFPPDWSGSHFDLDEKTYVDPPSEAFCEGLALAPPTIDELRIVCTLANIVDSWKFELKTTNYPFQLQLLLDDISIGVMENHYRAWYRFFLLGYLFSGAYLEPVMGRRPPYRTRLQQPHLIVDTDKVQQYPIYHTDDLAWRYSQLHKLFSGYINWIVADSRKRGVAARLCNITLYESNYSEEKGTGFRVIDAAGHGALREIMLLLTFLDMKRFMRQWSDYTQDRGYTPLHNNPTSILTEGAATGENVPSQVLTIWTLDRLRPERCILSRGLPSRCITKIEKYPCSPLDVLQSLFPPNNTDLESRPELDFFRIALKEHFGLRIKDSYYDESPNGSFDYWLIENEWLYDTTTEEELEDRGNFDYFPLECIPLSS